jgi:hypothetical protein
MVKNERAKFIAELAAVIHAGDRSDHENFERDDVSVAIRQAETIVTDVEQDHSAIFTHEALA